MAQLPAKQKFDNYVALIETKHDDLARLAPAHVADKAGFAARFITACKLAAARNPVLLQCSKESILRAALTGMSLGLLPEIGGHGYLIPFNNSKLGCKELTWMTGYQGMVELAHRSGHVSCVDAWLVYEGEKFQMTYGSDAKIVHVPDPNSAHEPTIKGDVSCESLGIVGAYAIVRFKDGATKFEYQNAVELDAKRKGTRSRQGPWFDFPQVLEMYRKCPIRKLAKLIPQSPDLHIAMGYDEAAERGVPQIIDVPRAEPEPEEELKDATPADEPKCKMTKVPDDGRPFVEPADDETPPEGPPATACPGCKSEKFEPIDTDTYQCAECGIKYDRDGKEVE